MTPRTRTFGCTQSSAVSVMMTAGWSASCRLRQRQPPAFADSTAQLMGLPCQHLSTAAASKGSNDCDWTVTSVDLAQSFMRAGALQKVERGGPGAAAPSVEATSHSAYCWPTWRLHRTTPTRPASPDATRSFVRLADQLSSTVCPQTNRNRLLQFLPPRTNNAAP
jgi:hypothetical protein